jgi:signal transduction histidine kinase
MKRLLYTIGLLIPLITFAQSQKVFVITDSTLAGRWTTLAQDWRYQKGDNREWANPAYDDSLWKAFSAPNLNMPDGKHAIANYGEIVWFRKHIKADSSLSKTIVLYLNQFGASEIYLDGKLIHQLGRVSADINKVVFNTSIDQLLELPLEKGKEQVLAVRYVNAQYKFPIYATTNGLIKIQASTFTNASTTNDITNSRIAFNKYFIKNCSIALGMAILMFLTFASFFLFFPEEKINGYFAASVLFQILFNTGLIWGQDYSGIGFWISLFYVSAAVVYSIIVLYCFYKLLEQPLDIIYKTIAFLGFVTIAGCFLYDPDILGPVWVILSMVVTIRIAIKSWNKKRVGSILFLSSSLISVLYWAIYILALLGLVHVNPSPLIPFAFMVMPVTLSIYLGYAFGKRSQELQLNLERVQKLSKEKESILSSQNENLEKQVQERTASLNQSLKDLKATQSQLIQSEKMASLGELTAGIAHEIQNPLNFVNNFSEINLELIGEIKSQQSALKTEEVDELLNDIAANEEKINHHGKRADAIVKGMLQHSRSSSGAKEPTNINALCDEYFRLAYHGLRAKDKSFNALMKTDFDEKIGTVNIIPQDIGRVILNLITNAFYTVDEKEKAKGIMRNAEGLTHNTENYQPTVSISTKKTNGMIEISVADNGNGIPEAIKEKIFQPFFTTKPTGQGTGLGLSLSYDIVKAHGGELRVETKEGEGSYFSILLPINN